MTPPAHEFQAAVDQAFGHVETLEPDLAEQYAVTLRKAGRRAARQFRMSAVLQPQLVAAGDVPTPGWTVPPVDELVDTVQVAADLLANTAETRQAAAVAATRPIMSAMGVSFSLESPMVADLVSRSGVRAAKISIPGLRDAVISAMTEAFSEGLSVPDTAALIEQQVDGLADYQSTMLARTDLIGTANGGSLLAAKVVYPQGTIVKRWVNATDSNTETDGRIRDTHLEANGQTVPLDGFFTVGGDQLLYPGDPTGADDEVINCRCVLVYDDPVRDINAAAWDESKHPRFTRGVHEGGRFKTAAERAREAKAIRDSVELTQEAEFGYVPARATDSPEMAALRADFGANPTPYLDGPGDGALNAVAELQGFDGLPEIVSAEELDRRIAEGHTELWRGMAGGEKYAQDVKDMAQLMELPVPEIDPSSGVARAAAFRSGDYYAGEGTWGNGTYTAGGASGPNVAISYADPTEFISETGSRLPAAKYAAMQPSIVRMALRPEARIAHGPSLREEWSAHMRTDEKPNRGQVITRSPELALDSDLGRYAAAKGYDAIDLDDGTGFVVLLNRTAVAVQEAGS